MEFDLLIIGGGPAGYFAAERAAEKNFNVAIVEKNGSFGGVCLNEGCIPSKNLLHSAKLYSLSKELGNDEVSIDVDLEKIVKQKNKVVTALTKGVAVTLNQKSVKTFIGEATILERNSLALNFRVKIDDQILETKNLLICAGSSASIPPIDGLKDSFDSGIAMTNKEILDLVEVPKKLAIIGGGVIGLEMAVAFSAFGSQVTIIEILDKIAGPLDRDITEQLQKNCIDLGINIQTNAIINAVEKNTIYWRKAEEEYSDSFDKIMVSAGRYPNSENLGLENIGVYTDQKGRIITDEQMRTNIPNVYAAGDINGRSMLAHTAYREAEVAINTMLNIYDEIDYDLIPNVIYTFPEEVASIGLSEEEAKKMDSQVRIIKKPMVYSGRYMVENYGGKGFAKLILDRDGEHILGFSMIGNPASEIISSLSVALSQDVSVSNLRRAVFPHPSVGEIIKELLY